MVTDGVTLEELNRSQTFILTTATPTVECPEGSLVGSAGLDACCARKDSRLMTCRGLGNL